MYKKDTLYYSVNTMKMRPSKYIGFEHKPILLSQKQKRALLCQVLILSTALLGIGYFTLGKIGLLTGTLILPLTDSLILKQHPQKPLPFSGSAEKDSSEA